MKIVPQMVERVISNAYTVRTGDTVASISEGFTGNPLRCDELVGANYHKRIVRCNDLPHFVFASLVDGETLNIPADWSDAPNVSMGVSGTASGTVGQTDALASELTKLIQDGANNGAWPMPVSNPANVAGMLSQWWPYLQVPPNGYSLPDVSTELYAWVQGLPFWRATVGFPNTPSRDLLGQLIGTADRWVTQFGLPAQPVAWDLIPWSKLAVIWAAFGGNTAQLQTFLQMISRLGEKSWSSNGWSGSRHVGGFSPIAGAIHGTPSCPDCAAPNFVTTDPRDEPFNTLVKWFATWPSSGVNPTNVPWDIATDPNVLACISAHPTRVDEMKADVACFPNVPAACGDSKAAFKKMLCAPVYTPGWCNRDCGAADCLTEGKMPCSVDSDCCPGLSCVNTACRPRGYVPDGGSHPEPTGVNKEGQKCNLGASIGCEEGLSCVNGVCSKPTVAVAAKSTSTLTIIAATVGVVGLAYLGYRAMQPKRNPIGGKGRSGTDWVEMYSAIKDYKRGKRIKSAKKSGELTDTSDWGIERELYKNREVTGRAKTGYFIRVRPDSTEPGFVYQVLNSPSATESLQYRYSEDASVIAREFVGSLSHSHPVRWKEMPKGYGYQRPFSKFAGMGHLEGENPSGHRARKDITLESGQYGWDYLIVHDDGRDVLIQTDHDYPSVASTFGWSGRVLKKFGTGYSAEIRAAQEWLDNHIGARAEDPGYFDGDEENE